MKKRLLGPNLNKTCKQLTHFPPCDFDSVLCAVLRVARQEVCRKKIWASWYLQNSFSTIKSLIKACKYADFHTKKRADARVLCANNSDRTKYALYVPRSRLPIASDRLAEENCGNIHVVAE
jgi:hypothetical protein